MRAAGLVLLTACTGPTVLGTVSDRPDIGVGADTGPLEPGPTGAVDCGLSHDLATPYWTEGETVAFTVSCRDAAGAALTLAVQGAPDAADFDAATGRFTWTTTGRDAGTWRLTLSADDPSSDAFPETRAVELHVADDADAPGATPPDPATYHDEWGLPVVHLDVHGELSQSDTPATITVRGEAREGAVKIRGAASTTYPKNSFTVDFGDEELEIAEWGDRSRGHLILTTTFDDNSYVRQKLVYDVWAAMADALGAERLTPRTFFTVVYLDGAYHGLYLGCDRIDDEFTRHMGFSGDGDLFKSVSHDANFSRTAANGSPKGDLAAGWEKKEGADRGDFDPIRDLTAAVADTDADGLWSGGAAWVDLEEVLDWHLLVVFSLSEDSAGKNAYLYQDAPGAPFRFAPWDFNASWGQNWYTARLPVEQVSDFSNRNRLFSLLMAHPDAAAELRRRYAVLADGGPFDPAWLDATVRAYTDTLGPAIDRDWARWGPAYERFERWETYRDATGDWTDPAGELDYLRGWLVARPAHVEGWLDELP